MVSTILEMSETSLVQIGEFHVSDIQVSILHNFSVTFSTFDHLSARAFTFASTHTHTQPSTATLVSLYDTRVSSI